MILLRKNIYRENEIKDYLCSSIVNNVSQNNLLFAIKLLNFCFSLVTHHLFLITHFSLLITYFYVFSIIKSYSTNT
jgi:hypothetical protein